MSVSRGKYKALERGKNIGCESIQVFIRSVRSWSSGPLDTKEIEDFKLKREENEDIWPILTHNSYLINLASTDDEKLSKSYAAMLDELEKATQLGIEYAVMHPGVIPRAEKNLSKETALDQIADQINKLLDDTKDSPTIILLENTAGQGVNLGDKFEDLRDIIQKITQKDRIGICYDTCHGFAAGYDFRTPEKYEALWDEFDDIIGLDLLFGFHLNDCMKECGSNIDRHEHIGKGKIGKKAFGFLVNDERFQDLPGVLETPKGEDMFEENLNVLKGLRE